MPSNTLKMMKIVNFMLSTFYNNWKKKVYYSGCCGHLSPGY